MHVDEHHVYTKNDFVFIVLQGSGPVKGGCCELHHRGVAGWEAAVIAMTYRAALFQKTWIRQDVDF